MLLYLFPQVTSAALDCGTTLSLLVIFFTLQVLFFLFLGVLVDSSTRSSREEA